MLKVTLQVLELEKGSDPKVLVTIDKPDCDPLLRAIPGGLLAACGAVPRLVDEAERQWAKFPRRKHYRQHGEAISKKKGKGKEVATATDVPEGLTAEEAAELAGLEAELETPEQPAAADEPAESDLGEAAAENEPAAAPVA